MTNWWQPLLIALGTVTAAVVAGSFAARNARRTPHETLKTLVDVAEKSRDHIFREDVQVIEAAIHREIERIRLLNEAKIGGFWQYQRERIRQSFGWIAMSAFSLAVIVVLLVYLINANPTGTAMISPTTGEDPATTRCLVDARVATAGDQGAALLEILYSPVCNAVWGRITRSDRAGFGNQVTVTVFRRSDPEGDSRQSVTESDVNAAYTPLIVRQGSTDTICAIGSITTNGVTEDVPPMCA